MAVRQPPPWSGSSTRVPRRLGAVYTGPRAGADSAIATTAKLPIPRPAGAPFRDYRSAAFDLAAFRDNLLGCALAPDEPLPYEVNLPPPAPGADPSVQSEWAVYTRVRDVEIPQARAAARTGCGGAYSVMPSWRDVAYVAMTPASITNMEPTAYVDVPEAGDPITSRTRFTPYANPAPDVVERIRRERTNRALTPIAIVAAIGLLYAATRRRRSR